MSGNKKALLDTNVIIDTSKGLIDLELLIQEYPMIYTSIISYVEALGYESMNEQEKLVLESIFAEIPIINLDLEIATLAINYRKKRKIKLPDAFILATAKKLDSDLLTRNLSDFQNIDESVKLVSPDQI